MSPHPADVGGPPDARRVARRALCLSAVAARGFLESDAPADAEEHRAGLVAWLAEHDLLSELEPAERALLDAPVGSLDPQALVDATWRSEGLAVLAWALGQAELPAHDEMVDVAALTSDLGFLDEPVVLVDPRLRADEERDRADDALTAAAAVSGADPDPERREVVASIAAERRQALHWLRGDTHVYSAVDAAD